MVRGEFFQNLLFDTYPAGNIFTDNELAVQKLVLTKKIGTFHGNSRNCACL